ncbi:DUF3083 family protein [Catenovulum maritimum]|uniref:DUF3083 family protein n=1 Tax=Catenovulum maritimum TaxID=1513271 RepID=A0A0J8GVR4_9ALTE|nr:DUF3083 family protein [Catenovulum maritimum]KMT66842.1 hypothetical protein XM47_01635 [Catenovulum maritimum]
MPITRNRSAQHKVYIPESARENQYLIAKFELTDQLLEKYASTIVKSDEQPYAEFYEALSADLFEIAESLGLETCYLVANDKFIRVRYSPEKIISQTEQQILFLYNPSYHFGQKAYYDGAKRADKIKILFLTNEDNIRKKSAFFHERVKTAISQYSEKLGLEKDTVRVCDHQHLTYDLFAKEKGDTGTQAHKLRAISDRFSADGITVSDKAEAQTYAIADLPITRRIRNLLEIDKSSEEPYTPLYELISKSLVKSAEQNGLDNCVIIANDLIPVVRSKKDESVSANGELQLLNFTPDEHMIGFAKKWEGDQLVDKVQFVFVASHQNMTSYGYGKFLNQIQQTMRSVSNQLGYKHDEELMPIRFHQHIGFSI